ncbi:MAG: PKD domain-containing protein [Candidatus Thermoplasmatota archaeon]|jgi:hypothetical protein|nr:PKD domain-containing protein [Candidatus Thermoplasmatota archaeon]
MLLLTAIVVLLASQFSYNPDDGLTENRTATVKNAESNMENYAEAGSRFTAERDIPTWRVGDWWEYNTTFNNSWTENSDFLFLNGTVKYTLRRVEMFAAADGNSYLAYNCTISGGSVGNAVYAGAPLIVNGDRFSEVSTTPGETTGYRIYRASDLAILHEQTYMEGFVHTASQALRFKISGTMFDLDMVDIFDLPISPGENYNYSTQQNRTFSLYLSELGYYLKRFSEVFPFAYDMTSYSESPVTVNGGTFDAYRFSAISTDTDDPSTMNFSYSADVKSLVKHDIFRITLTDDGDHSVLDTTMELNDHHLTETANTIDTNTEQALLNIPIKVSGTFPGYPTENVVVTFPYTGVTVDTTTDALGIYSCEINTPGIYDNSPTDQDLSSFGVCAYLKDNMNEIITKSILIVGSDDDAPVADAGTDTVTDENEIIFFDGSGSSDNMAIKTYQWSFDHNSTPVNLPGKDPSFLFTHPGTYEVSLTVTDYSGNTDTDSSEITVNDTTVPVAVLPEEMMVDEGKTVVFNGSNCFDPEGGSVSEYTWTFVYNGTNLTLNGELASYIFDIPGTYQITLEIIDLNGNSATDNFIVRVKDITLPTAMAGPDLNGTQGKFAEFNGSLSSDNVGVVSWTWTLTYDGTDQVLHGKTSSFVFQTVGDYLVTLRVTDAMGLARTDTLWVNISDSTPPTAVAGDDKKTDQGEAITFDGRVSMDNVGIIIYVWTFEDDGPQTLHGVSLTYIFSNVGNFTVTLTVTDAAGNRANDTFYIVVSDVTGPVAPANLKDQDIKDDEEVKLDAGDWIDDGSATFTYTWTITYGGKVVTLHEKKPDFDFTEAINYEIVLTVKNDAGLTTVVEYNINVIDTDPKNKLENVKIKESSTLDILIPNDFADMDIEVCHWILTEPDGNEVGNFTTYSQRLSYPGELQEGTYEITLLVKDRNGNSASQTFKVVVGNKKAASGDDDKIKFSGPVRIAVAIIAGFILLNVIFLGLVMRGRGKERKMDMELADKKKGSKKRKAKDVEEMEVVEVEALLVEYFCPRCHGVIGEDDDVCRKCGAEFSEDEVMEVPDELIAEQTIEEAVEGLEPGDVIVSRSGTERTILSMNGDKIRVRTRTKHGTLKTEEINRKLLMNLSDALEEIRKAN